MDPLSALSVAAGVVQFVDFTFRLVSGTRAIIRSKSGLGGDANTLDAIARDAAELSDALAASPALATSSTTLQTLVGECKAISENLLAVLEKLLCRPAWQGAGPNLDSYALPPVSVQIYSLQESAQRLGMEDQNRVENLRDDVVKRLERLSEETSRTQEDMRQLMQNLEPNASKPTTARPTRLGLSLELANYFSAVIKHLAEEQSLMASNQDFLESLYFSKIKARQRKIESAHSKTFGWVFRPSVPDGSKTISFYQWLCEGNGTFWIQGKAGSGKSTLMKFICSHATTMELLRVWAGSKRLITAKFFFWNAGTLLQKSREGLLRSLLFEILRKCPELIPRVSKGNRKTPFRRRGPYSQADDEELWSQEELMEAYRSLHMIDSIPAIYLPHMARTLWMATSVSQPQFLMVYSLLDDVSDSITAFGEEHSPKVMYDHEVRTRAQQMRRRLDGRCKGLLEVVLDEPDAGLYFEYKVDFLHRTVRDFLLGSPKIRRILEEQRFTELSGISSCDGNVWLLPCLSILEAFKRAPFRTGPQAAAVDAELAVRLLESLMMFAYEAEANMSDRSALIRMLFDAEKTYDLRRWQFSWPLDTNLFLGLACQADLFSYIEKRITPGWFTQPSDSDSISLSSWRTFLTEISSMVPFLGGEQVRETLRLLLKYDIPLDTEIRAGDGRLITAGKIIEEILHRGIGELQGEHTLELSESKEESDPEEEPSKHKEEESGSKTGGQFGISSWLFSWWSK
ncbi:hypothetical protein F5Y12DRAFT_789534 [Xylaria sp. FL1777]|nr:hypothetical protein F5Y12DRAFT_789534 [Xylaria sp. FL1777]